MNAMQKVLLCILDGFGYTKSTVGNATLEAKYITELVNSNNTVFLEASGRHVGLPEGQFGNSEVGHLTIGSGQIFKQKLPMITDAIKSGELETEPKLLNFISRIGTCHLMGLFSSGGVHSDIEHFFWAIKFLRKNKITIKAHLFLDGRDVGFRDAFKTLEEAIKTDKIHLSEIATIQGRFYAMDRDNRLDRTKCAYDAVISAIAEYKTATPLITIKDFYNRDISDEMMPPIILENYTGADKNDGFWMLNFRTDRIKQILKMLLDNGFDVMNMVDCGEEISSRSVTLFPEQEINNTLGEILSKNGVKQLRIAETEKYAHVTYFFNGGKDVQFEGEDRILIPSPKVKDYSETPDMSASAITQKVIEAMQTSSHQVIILNFANADMLGHTGDFEATKQSMRLLDAHVKQIIDTAKVCDYAVILTADHGNAEEMINEDGSPKKTHTCAPVPFIVIPDMKLQFPTKTIADVAPNVLKILRETSE